MNCHFYQNQNPVKTSPLRCGWLLLLVLVWCTPPLFARNTPNGTGIITGTVMDGAQDKALPQATVELTLRGDSTVKYTVLTVKDGGFLFEHLAFGWYRLRISLTGYNTLTLDSIHLRAERFDFDLNELKLNPSNRQMEEVVVYAEKPLIESKDGKITFNTGESALSAGATGTELLKQTPLVNVDNDGKVLLKGKETKVLIDDKPVELNARQLQDLLESMPGSMIEKIEVMTTPPPQYANERGGVINIVTKKGKVGMSGRLSINGGTRGEAGISGNFSYRRKKLGLNFTAGFGYNDFDGSSFSNRQNIYTDSVNYFNTTGQNNTLNHRPNLRLSIDYELNKKNSLNFTSTFNSNDAGNSSTTTYTNLNSNNAIYRLSNRYISSGTESINPGISATYSRKFKNPRAQLRLITAFNQGTSQVDRDFYQQFLNPDYSFSGNDSTQEQNTEVKSRNFSVRLNLDHPLNAKLQLNTGGSIAVSNSHTILNTAFLKKPDGIFVKNNLLSNDFRFRQAIATLRLALRYDIITDFYINAGVQAERTAISFDLKAGDPDAANHYLSWLPFATMIRKWKSEISLTLSYKRTIQRPGLNELNPSVDYGDPYNTRFGNPYLQPYYADNYDLIVGKWNKGWYLNGAIGYNTLTNIYSAIRTLQPDGKTTTTWQNISGRTEYESSAWGGYTISKKSKVNISLGYTYNVYSRHDREVNRFRNGGSFFSTLNGNYQFTSLLGSNASFTFNRFANPQGTVRNTLSMNIGAQYKLLNKKMTISLNIIDPFRQQQNHNTTYGSNFYLESFSATQTRNIRLSLSYVFSKNAAKTNKLQLLRKLNEKNKATPAKTASGR